MAYFDEVTIKMSLICVIRQIADKLKVEVSFDNLDELDYQDLTTFRDELLLEYNAKVARKPKSVRAKQSAQ